MQNSNTNLGITKESTLRVEVPPFLPNNYQQVLNYVGYWKWNSTNQIFEQVLNNQDIIDRKYNLKIQPLFYDADTGLPQKVTVNSGNTKKLKLKNDNNDGASELTEYVENNTMVRFNSKTRSITEYPYFEVEALPPTITSPITSNGYYKFNGNTLISGTDQDYNINVNVAVNNVINIDKIILDSYDITSSSSGWKYYSNSGNVTTTQYYTNIIITKNNTNNTYDIHAFYKTTSGSSTMSVNGNTWTCKIYRKGGKVDFFKNNQMICSLEDMYGDTSWSTISLSQDLFNFNEISWMTFN